ncbi:hypothetical protein [Shimia ponticola]|uniref:hypothetical protein n=1 Tax=Shimia ponticola TaxID=2582893 RepID=UPI0011BE8F14|nr:hypothetical protein [Shimia ponticola]
MQTALDVAMHGGLMRFSKLFGLTVALGLSVWAGCVAFASELETSDVNLAEIDLLDRYWIIREEYAPPILPCQPDAPCGETAKLNVLPLQGGNPARIRRIYGQMAALSAASNVPDPHPDQPAICAVSAAQSAGVAGVYVPDGWNPKRLTKSAKNEGLRGLTAVQVDLSGLPGPRGWEGDFGADLQERVITRFEEEGLRVLTKDEVETHPGKPQMAVYLSHTNYDTGCWWSIFSSVTETAVLTRDLNVKLRSGIWSQSVGYSADDPDRSEFDAVTVIIETFLADWRAANALDFEVTNVPPYRWDEAGNLIPNEDG